MALALQVQNDLSFTDMTKRALIVHEAVHALSDIRRQKMNALQAESAAFIAQALYQLKYRGGKKWKTQVGIFVAALDVSDSAFLRVAASTFRLL